MATVSLLIAIRLGDKAIDNAGNYPLTKYELETVRNVTGVTQEDISNLQLDIQSLSVPDD